MDGKVCWSQRYRGLLVLAAMCLVGLVAIPAAQSTQGQPVIAGQFNSETSFTTLNASGSGRNALLVVGDAGAALEGVGNGTGEGVMGNDPNGIGVEALNSSDKPALLATNGNSSAGVAVEAKNTAPNFSAIYGHHDAATSGLGVYGEAPIGIGVQGKGSVDGVRGFSDIVSGTGVLAENTAGGTALKTTGAVTFSTAGIATVPTGQKQVTIPAGVDVTTTTKVLVTPMSTGGSFKWVELDEVADNLIFHLSKLATRNVTLAYFVIS